MSVWGIGNQFETAHSVSSVGPQRLAVQDGGDAKEEKVWSKEFAGCLNLIRLPAHSL